MFMFIEGPNGVYAYIVSVLMVLCTGMENVAVDVVMLRSADKEIRGVVFGVGNACGYMGMLIFSAVGGIMFDSVGPYSPFIYVGALDITFAVICTVCSLCGWIRNDILEREVQLRLKTGK